MYSWYTIVNIFNASFLLQENITSQTFTTIYKT